MMLYLALLIAVAMLAGCGTQSPDPSNFGGLGTPGPQITLSPEGPSVTPSEPAAGATRLPGPVPIAAGAHRALAVSYAPAIAMRVAVPELNVRSAPSLRGEKLHLARRDDVVLAHDWPVVADGYTWYRGHIRIRDGTLPALPDILPPGIDFPDGWFAASSDDGPYMVALPLRCPGDVNLENVSALLESERLACFGNATLEFEGGLGCAFCEGISGSGTPGWLASEHAYSVLVADEDHGLQLFLAPGVGGAEALGSRARVRGHFDDPAALSCSFMLEDSAGEFQLDPVIAFEFCRQRFVVESVELLGAA
jgi:hypothetical protein